MIASIFQGPIPRLVPVGLILLALQKTLFVELQPFGVIVQVVLAFAVACGAGAGPERGAVAGFVLGLMVDLGTGSPLGTSSITMGIGAFAAGWVTIIDHESHWWFSAVFVAFGAAIGEFCVPVVHTLLGETSLFGPELYTIIPVVAVAAAIMSPLFIPVGRWCMRVHVSEWKAPPE